VKLRTRPDHNFVDSGSGQQIARLSSNAAHDAGKVLASKRTACANGGRRAGNQVDKILKGNESSDLPAE